MTTATITTTNYIPVLDASINYALGIAPTLSVFALGDDFFPECNAGLPIECGCLAICAPVAREDWATITPGQIVLFTHFQRPSNGEPTVLRTHCGPLTVYDAQRGALYAEMMDAYYDVQGFAADDLQGMHVVERFIELPE